MTDKRKEPEIVPPHPQLRKPRRGAIDYASRYHTESEHLSHGEDAYRRTHSGKEKPVKQERRKVPVRITIDLSEMKMLLDMFATVEEAHGLTGDMLQLYERVKVIEPLATLF